MAVAAVKITATDDSGSVHRAQVRGFPPETIDNMAVLQIYGLASHAMPGTDAVALFASGDRSNGVIIATGNQQFRLRHLKPGEVALYTDEGDKLVFERGRLVEIVSGAELRITVPLVTINASTKVRMVTPRLEVTGDIIDHCDTQPHTAANERAIYNSHTHGNVQSGPAHTAIPDQPMREGDDT
jgi:phage baseplate assembly protein V